LSQKTLRERARNAASASRKHRIIKQLSAVSA
jgi:hypothetical protein